ncbi:IclR family transcriptional regulator [Rahnella sp. SAP-1]|jgi:DNA-binding IclR family transcriptional regulator|uniref:IclR family transcriptional regulator n=1 Tax=Rouxiella aceris TaxID=2703884 RepID=A0A848MPI1_9GAMM|nr:IclR family transcriptional regulator [Rouxiella aceris]NMP28920.1 IclR family transcriptional regulator [Rouxiella aceris]
MSILITTANILRLMSQLERGVTVKDLTEHLAMPKSTAARVLKQLKDSGFVDKNRQSQQYEPGLMFLDASYLVRRHSSLIDVTEKALRELCQQTGHTGYVSIMDKNDVLALRVIPGSHPLQVVTHPGKRSSVWGTSTGRAILSRMTDAQIAAQLRETLEDPAFGSTLDFAQLMQRINQVRDRHWSAAINELVSGVASVSCSVKDPGNGECLAFCLSFPAAMADDAEIDRLSTLVCSAAKKIAQIVGDRYWSC